MTEKHDLSCIEFFRYGLNFATNRAGKYTCPFLYSRELTVMKDVPFSATHLVMMCLDEKEDLVSVYRYRRWF